MEAPTLPEPSSSPSAPAKSPLVASTHLPPTTMGTSASIRARTALVCARAGITDPLTTLLTLERLSYPDPSTITVSHLEAANTLRLDHKLAAGAFIVEAASFAAVACWEPPAASAHEAAEVWDGVDPSPRVPGADRRPIFMEFLRRIAEGKRETLPRGTRYWHLSLMARDPGRKDKGAVRALIEPYVARARREGVPVWLEAGNERARDVYAYFGFRVVGEIRSGVGEWNDRGQRKEGGEGVPTWLMVANWPVAEVKS